MCEVLFGGCMQWVCSADVGGQIVSFGSRQHYPTALSGVGVRSSQETSRGEIVSCNRGRP